MINVEQSIKELIKQLKPEIKESFLECFESSEESLALLISLIAFPIDNEIHFNPEIDDDSFYKMIDDLLMVEPDIQKAHLHKPEEKLPLGSKKLAEKCELELYQGLRDRLDGWFDTVNKDSDPDEVISNLKMALHDWTKSEKSQVRESLQQLYNRGLESGMRSTGILIEPQKKKIDYLIYRDTGISPALDRFRDETFNQVAKII